MRLLSNSDINDEKITTGYKNYWYLVNERAEFRILLYLVQLIIFKWSIII